MDSLSTLLSSRAKAETFRLIFAPGAGELHVREIARRAGLNDATVRQELKRLTGLCLLTCSRDASGRGGCSMRVGVRATTSTCRAS